MFRARSLLGDHLLVGSGHWLQLPNPQVEIVARRALGGGWAVALGALLMARLAVATGEEIAGNGNNGIDWGIGRRG